LEYQKLLESSLFSVDVSSIDKPRTHIEFLLSIKPKKKIEEKRRKISGTETFELNYSLSEAYVAEDTSNELAKFSVFQGSTEKNTAAENNTGSTEKNTPAENNKDNEKVNSKSKKENNQKQKNINNYPIENDTVYELDYEGDLKEEILEIDGEPVTEEHIIYYPWGCSHFELSDQFIIDPLSSKEVYFDEISQSTLEVEEELTASVSDIFIREVPQATDSFYIDESNIGNLNTGKAFIYVK